MVTASTRHTEVELTDSRLDLLTDLIERARKAGADAADALMFDGFSLQVSHRLGKPEDLEQSEGRDLGLRVFVGKQQAFVSSTDFDSSHLDGLVERAVAMAKATPEDPFCGLADPALLAKTFPALDLVDETQPTPETLYERAARCEAAALAVDGVTNSEEAGASWSRSDIYLATSDGFAGQYAATDHSFYTSVLAGSGTAMERDWEFSSARHGDDLETIEDVGRRAGVNAVRRLNPRKMKTVQVPVVYSPRVSNSILGHLSGAISGHAVARGTSFLKDCLNTQIFNDKVNVIDDPHRPRGLRSKPFDGEGVANRKWRVIEDGVLSTWFMDSSAGRQLSLTSTGHAVRGTAGPPGAGPSNLYMAAGDLSPGDLMSDIAEGFYVTELIGMGVNGITGDYSRGASGFWIKDGQIGFPVSELTIAGQLQSMFKNLTPADDLQFRYGTNAPTLRIENMTVAGT